MPEKTYIFTLYSEAIKALKCIRVYFPQARVRPRNGVYVIELGNA